LVFLAGAAFDFSIKLSLSQAMSFLTFAYLTVSPAPLGGVSECCVRLSCQLGSNHGIHFQYLEIL